MQQNDLSTLQARAMRRAMTPAERALWNALRDRRLLGLKFRRQVPVGPWIADFYCAAHRLVIEADSGDPGSAGDIVRDRWMALNGFRVLRFRNSDTRADLRGCLERIADEVAQ
jgi:very-short-patch-repair endonuclease